MPEREPSFGSMVKESLILTLGFEGAVFSILTDIDPRNRWSADLKSSTNTWYQTWLVAALASSVKAYLFIHEPGLRQWILAYEGIVFSAMLIGEAKNSV